MRFLRVALVAVLALGGLLALPATARAEGSAHVSVLHGVPGATVDVYANGKALLTNFAPGTLTDPTALPAGNYDLKVVAAGAGADGEAVIEAKGVAVPAGANITVVAHLDADGKPVLTPFVNDLSTSSKGGRLVVRHVAAAPGVDVRAGGKVVFTNLTNPNEDKADLAAGTVSADVVLTGTDTVAIGPADVTVKDGYSTIVYAWGSAADNNLKLAVQNVKLGGHLPKTGSGQMDALPGLAGVALVAVALMVAVAIRARRTA